MNENNNLGAEAIPASSVSQLRFKGMQSEFDRLNIGKGKEQITTTTTTTVKYNYGSAKKKRILNPRNPLEVSSFVLNSLRIHFLSTAVDFIYSLEFFRCHCGHNNIPLL